MHKLHNKISLNFLIAGHTKFSPDWCFGLIKQRLRKTRVNTLAEIADVVRQSTVTGVNVPQLVGKEDGTVNVECSDWNNFLNEYFRPFPGIKSFQHFEFDSERPGIVVEEFDSTETTTFEILRNPNNLPPAIGQDHLLSPGLDATRQAYLFDQIRDEPARDITCPRPTKVVRRA
jgi:hypothetical protein